MYSLDSDGFSGTYSSEYQAGCVSRLCCGAGCCSPDMQYDESKALCVSSGPVCTKGFSGPAYAISKDGNVAAVRHDDDKVRVYRWNTQTWVHIGSDIIISKFGLSASLSTDGSILALGSRDNRDNGINAGLVRVFQWNETDWDQMGNNLYGEKGDSFGYSVSLSSDGSILAVGATGDGDGYRGSFRAFQWNASGWSQLGQEIVRGSDYFGESVSLSSNGSIVAVGAGGNTDSYEGDTGCVYVLELIGTIWRLMGKPVCGEGDADEFGHSVSLSANGNILSVGAPYNDGVAGENLGHNRIFYWNGENWRHTGILDGTRPFNAGVGEDGNFGHVRTYRWSGASWDQRGSDIDGEAANDEIGWSVPLSNDGGILAVGAQRSGTVLYQWIADAWVKVEVDIDLSGNVYLSGNGSTFAVGAYLCHWHPLE